MALVREEDGCSRIMINQRDHLIQDEFLKTTAPSNKMMSICKCKIENFNYKTGGSNQLNMPNFESIPRIELKAVKCLKGSLNESMIYG